MRIIIIVFIISCLVICSMSFGHWGRWSPAPVPRQPHGRYRRASLDRGVARYYHDGPPESGSLTDRDMTTLYRYGINRSTLDEIARAVGAADFLPSWLQEIIRRYLRDKREEDRVAGGNGGVDRPTRPITPPIDEVDDPELLKVTSVDLLVATNARYHHTAQYEQTESRSRRGRGVVPGQLIVRRGQPFKLRVSLNRDYQADTDYVRIILQTGSNPRPGKGSFVRLTPKKSLKPKTWSAALIEVTDKSLHLEVTAAPQCIVGRWRLSVEVGTSGNVGNKHDHEEEMFILFNPWSEDDATHMPDTDKLAEYILNDAGCIYVGTGRQIRARMWNFGQFEDGVLEAALDMIEEGFGAKQDRSRGDPAKVARVISQMINSNDDGGVILGNWSGDYSGGTAPTSWSGSAPILEEYIQTGRSVKFGQCWVFAGVLNTVCRAVGLPCRVITNFSSAHDTDGSVTIDSYYHWNGAELEHKNTDSVWNFHVWNEVWMKRHDLDIHEYNGWQVLDATPQEASHNGVYCLGPTPVKAIRKGDMSIQHDAEFVFAEVNSDRLRWVRRRGGGFTVTSVLTDVVGKHISTKTPDGHPVTRYNVLSKRLDVTHLYKHREGSKEERQAVLKATKQEGGVQIKFVLKDPVMKIHLVEPKSATIGDDVTITIKLTNLVTNDLSVQHLDVKIELISYTGVVIRTCKSEKLTYLAVLAEKHIEFTQTVQAADYLPFLSEMNSLKVTATALVADDQSYVFLEETVQLDPPNLDIQVPESAKVDETVECIISLDNPLNVTLTQCSLYIEGPGLQKAKKISINNIPARRTWSTTELLRAKKPGQRQILVSFDSTQLRDVRGSEVITIT